MEKSLILHVKHFLQVYGDGEIHNNESYEYKFSKGNVSIEHEIKKKKETIKVNKETI